MIVGDWIESGLEFIDWKEAVSIDDRVGLQVELADGRRLLIGHSNPVGGGCLCCEAIDAYAVVARYRRVVTADELAKG